MKVNFTTIVQTKYGKVIQNHELKTVRGVKNRIFNGFIDIRDNTEHVDILDSNNNLVERVSADDIYKHKYYKLLDNATNIGEIEIDGTKVNMYKGYLFENKILSNHIGYILNGKHVLKKIYYDLKTEGVPEYIEIDGNRRYICR